MALDNADVTTILSDPRLYRVSASLASLARRSIRINATLTAESELEVGQSKMGGLPDLPLNMAWPTGKLTVPPFAPGAIRSFSGRPLPDDAVISLPFIAQIRVSDLKQHNPQLTLEGVAGDVRGLLPERGILYFFHNTVYYGYDWLKYDWLKPVNWRVFWHDDASDLRRTDYPQQIPEECRYLPCSLTFTTELTLPHVETCFIGDRYDTDSALTLTEDEWDVYAELLYEQRANHKIHQMLGHSDDYQPYMMEAGYWDVHRQFFPELPEMKEFSLSMLQSELEHARLLLQVDEESNGMQFGRGGKLYFFIRAQDLAAHDFSRVWARE